ncbi:MAG: capsule assembly Wzi family protein, partial [Gammaproteobacteria bacterium]|nr:capsule assembly Wzi family protein [Gammaproteobacteria bacterium]
MRFQSRLGMLLVLTCVILRDALAGPYIPAGDMALRHDIQQLARAGVIKGPTTTWPLAWGPILEDIGDTDSLRLSPEATDALTRVRDRANWQTRSGEFTFNAKVSVAENAAKIRSFQDTPRGNAEFALGASWIDDWFSVELNAKAVDSDHDNDEFRVDDSLIGVVVGNWSVAASTQQRWWGPGWDGSLILSNNARPIPSL